MIIVSKSLVRKISRTVTFINEAHTKVVIKKKEKLLCALLYQIFNFRTLCSLNNSKMNCSWCENFKTFAVVVVLIQLFFGVFRHIYQQFIKPALNGDNINFKKYGVWARKLYHKRRSTKLNFES